jgi:hypothetical protein
MFKSIEIKDQDDFCDFLRMDEVTSDKSWFTDGSSERQSDITSDSLLNSFTDTDKNKGFLS